MRRLSPFVFFLTGLLTPISLGAQTSTYHLHKEASATAGLYQLKTAGPDGTALAIQTVDLRNLATGEYVIKQFDTQANDPNLGGTIPANSTLNFTIWMKKTGTSGVMYPRVRVRLNSATGAQLCEVTGGSELNTTLTPYTLTCTTTSRLPMTLADRFYVWAGVSLTTVSTKSVKGELDVEGTLNGNYDSRLTIPLPVTVGTISGTVTRVTGGAAVSSATVQILQTGMVKATTSTATNGTYSISNLPAGTYDVRVSGTGYATELRSGTAVAEADTTTVNVGLYATGSISGRVTQSDGVTPIVGANVTAYAGATEAASGSTNSTGDYTLGGLRPGTYTVQTSAAGYQTAAQSTTVNEGATSTVNASLSVAPAGTITYVYDELGRLISVVDPGSNAATYGYDAVGNLLSIARQGSGAVSISEFTPNSGPIGAAVTIYGTGFSTTPSQNTVTFSGVSAVVASATATRIDTSVPSGTTTGLIGITSPNGSATSSSSFTVTTTGGAPTITSFTPAVAVAGSVVNITGSNFENSPLNDRVTFNIAYATVSSATATSISATVPGGTTSGRIAVATPYGKATSTADFFVPPPPYAAADVEFTSRMSFSETRAVPISTAGKIGLLVFDGTAGQRFSLNETNSTYTCQTTKVLNPDGSTLVSASPCGSHFFDTRTLTRTGTHTIFVDPSGTATGSVTLTLYDVPPDVTGTITPGGPSVTVSTTVPGQNGQLTFSGTTGQRISLKLTNTSYPCVDIRILNPDLSQLLGYFPCSDSFIDTTTLTATGTHTIVVDPTFEKTGSVTLTLYDVPPDVTGVVIVNGAALSVTVTTPGQNAIVTFNGTANQQATVRITNNTMSCVTVSLFRQDGVTQLTSSQSCSASFNLTTQTLPATESYSIRIDPSGTNTGGLSVSVTSP